MANLWLVFATTVAIDAEVLESTTTLIDTLYSNLAVILALVGSVLVFIKQVSNMFANVISAIKDKADAKDIQGIAEELKHVELFIREIKELQEISAIANMDNKFLDDDTKSALANVINDYNTVDTLTKEQWKKIKEFLTSNKEVE
jgi:predicted PurR-regulated permease PerM